jgi:benzil reductase ((S)-benzoin forming)
MEYYFITGSSFGIGKDLTEQILQKDNTHVYGFARHQTITHARYSHQTIDLSDLNEIKQFIFPEPSQMPTKMVLVNNAGIIGDINFVGRKSADKIIDTFVVNTITPSVLTNQFLKQFEKMEKSEKIILNISSGAGRHPISAWADYCASKAAVDMYSEVFNEEQIYQESHSTHIFSIAPGIVDTNMQAEIRQSNEQKFPFHRTFVDYHKNNLLTPTHEVSERLLNIIENPANYQEVILDLRQL